MFDPHRLYQIHDDSIDLVSNLPLETTFHPPVLVPNWSAWDARPEGQQAVRFGGPDSTTRVYPFSISLAAYQVGAGGDRTHLREKLLSTLPSTERQDRNLAEGISLDVYMYHNTTQEADASFGP